MPVRPLSAYGTAKLAVLFYLLTSAGLFAQRPLGIDVSDYQTTIDWTQVKGAGITFAWTKATEGTGGLQSSYSSHITGAKAAGIPIGSYHYARYDLNTGTTGATSEANNFWNVAKNNIKNGGQFLMPMLDVEASNAGYTTATLSAWVNAWCNTVSNNAYATGVIVRPAIYVSACHASWMDTSVSHWIPWIADYNGQNPQTSTPWTTCTGGELWGSGKWTVWQYTSTGTIAGISGNVDHDVFYDTATTLNTTLVIGGGGPQITNQPDSVVATVGTNVSFAVQSTGSSLQYQWKFNLTNITGATASSYTIPNVDPTNAGNYSVSVSNSTGSSLSDYAYLSVSVPPTNAPDAIMVPTGMVNWFDGQADTADSYGTLIGTPHGNFHYSPGMPGLGFHFDGSSSYLTTGAASLAVPWTLSLWVNRQNAPGTSAALLSDGTYSFKLEQYNGTRQVGITHFSVADYTFGYVVPANTWTHLAMVGTSTGTSLYINGALQSSLTNSQPLPRNYMGVSYVTSGGVITDYLLASVDEIATFNRALSAAEINAIYTAGANGFLRAPECTSITSSGSSVQVNLRGITGKSFSVYRSPDLFSWTYLGRFLSSTGTLPYFDTNNGSPAYFYKAAQP